MFANMNASGNDEAIDIFMHHATGIPKSTYYPLVSHIFALFSQSNIRSVILVDARNHTDSALLNRDLLPVNGDYKELGGWPWTEDAVEDSFGVLKAFGLERGGRERGKRKLVGLGHSFGGAVT